MVVTDRLSWINGPPAYLSVVEHNISIPVFAVGINHKQIDSNSGIDDTDLRNLWKE